MLSKITSPANSHIKEIARLRDSRHRRKNGLIIVDGARDISRAFAAGVVCRELFALSGEISSKNAVSSNLLKQCPAITEVSESVFEKISYGERDDGWVGVFEVPHPSESWPIVKNPLYFVLDQVEKPGNIGAMLRTADAVGVDGVMICGTQTDLYNPNIIRASTGMVFSLPIVCRTSEEALDFLKSRKVKICAADPDSKTVYTSADLSTGVAIVLGREDTGVDSFWMKHADLKVKIPMRGRADSLNVSISAAVIAYEAVRQRQC